MKNKPLKERIKEHYSKSYPKGTGFDIQLKSDTLRKEAQLINESAFSVKQYPAIFCDVRDVSLDRVLKPLYTIVGLDYMGRERLLLVKLANTTEEPCEIIRNALSTLKVQSVLYLVISDKIVY